MSNPERGEVSLDILDKHLVLKFSNAGRRAMEDFLDIEISEIDARVNTGRIGSRMLTGMFWGATRKHEARKFPSIADVDEFMDELDDADEDADGEITKELVVALIAAYNRSTTSETEARLFGDSGAIDEQPSENGDGSSAAPKDKTTKKAAPASG